MDGSSLVPTTWREEMGSRWYGEMRIGGPLPGKVLAHQVAKEVHYADPDEIRVLDGHLYINSETADCGQFPCLEEWLIDHKNAFVSECPGYGELEGLRRVYRPDTGEYCELLVGESGILVREGVIRRVLQELRERNYGSAEETLSQAIGENIRELQPLREAGEICVLVEELRREAKVRAAEAARGGA